MDCKKEIERGEALFTEGRLEEAEAVFTAMLEECHEDPEAYNNLGVIENCKGDPDKAEQYFLKALSVEENSLDALLNLGSIYQKTGRWEEAASCLKKSLEMQAPNFELYNQLGLIYLELGEREKARVVLEKSLDLNPAQEIVHESLNALKGEASRSGAGVNKRPLNILFVQEAPCIRNYKMATALRSRGHSVSLAYTKARLSQMYKGLGDDVYNRCIRIQNYRQLWDISSDYDVVHCHNEPDVLTVAALAGDTPVVHDTHDLVSLRAAGEDESLSYFEGVANRGADGRVYTTPFQMQEASELYGVDGPSLVFYNYASQSDIPSSLLPKLSEKDGRFHLVYEGGVGVQGHRDFSELFLSVASDAVRIHIYPTRYVEQIADIFKPNPYIAYHKPLSLKEIIRQMSQYDAGIIPFNMEKGNKRFLDSTIANKLIEYLAAGLPVVASPLKSYVEYFKDNPVGFVFHTPDDIVSRIDELKDIAEKTDLTRYVRTYESEIGRMVAFYQHVIRGGGEKVESPGAGKNKACVVCESVNTNVIKTYR